MRSLPEADLADPVSPSRLVTTPDGTTGPPARIRAGSGARQAWSGWEASEAGDALGMKQAKDMCGCGRVAMLVPLDVRRASYTEVDGEEGERGDSKRANLPDPSHIRIGSIWAWEDGEGGGHQ